MTAPVKSRRVRAANRSILHPGAVPWLLGFLILLAAGPAIAATYVSTPTTFTWVDPAGHTPATWSGLTQCSGGGAPTDDDITAPIPIGFTFNFGGVNYTTVRIMSNGRLQFNNNFCGYGTQIINPRTYPYPIPTSKLVRTLRVYGNDLDPAIGGSVTYATIGTAPNREFVVTFTNVPEWDASNAPGSFFNLQVILYENGDFVYQFGPSNNPSGGHAQIGWELTTGDYALISFSNIGALNGTAIRFTRATALDHFKIGVGAGTASTCKPLAITITAENAVNNVLTTYGGLVEVSDSAGHGDWSINTASGTLTPGAADSGTATYRFAPADNGGIVLNLSDVHADDLTIAARDPATGVTTTSADVSFRDNAFVITPTDALGTQVVAGRPHGFDAALWRKDPTTGVCAIATQYAGAKALKAWYTPDLNDPPGARAPAIGAVALPASAPGANNVTFNFTSGQAPFTLNTTDVGKYALDLRDDTGTFAKTLTGTARTLDGASPTLTVRPFALALVNVLAGATPNPGADTAGGAVFTGAGNPFAATVRGVLWQAGDDPANTGSPAPGADLADNPVTPSFAWSTTLAAAAPYQPSGGVLGTLTLGGAAPVTLAAGAYANGAATASPLAYSEVGAFTLRALTADYLDTPGVNASGTAVLGRFIPAWFTTAVTPGCGTTFTYSGQPFTVTATAYNAFGAVTRNYDGALGFAKTTTFSDAGAGTSGSLADHVLSGLDYVQGVGSDNTITYTFTNRGTLPYPLKVRATDTDGVSSAGHAEGTTEIRSGRVFLQNAFGSELLALQLPLAVQYYRDATARWTANAADTCTTLTQGDFTLGNWTGALLSGDTAVTAVTLSAGSGSLTLSAPGAGKVGSVDVTGNVPAWLRYDWNPTGAATDPVGRASFGVFKGPDSVIYQREWY